MAIEVVGVAKLVILPVTKGSVWAYRKSRMLALRLHQGLVQRLRNLRVSSFIYAFLWVMALPTAFFSVLELEGQNQLGLSVLLAWLFGLTSAGLLVMIYFDVHAIERLQGGNHDYPNWVGVGRKSEVVLRILIVSFLLFAVGEFHVIQESVLKLMKWLQPSQGPVGSINESYVFVYGSAGAFGLIVIWNTAALIQRCRTHKTTIGTIRNVQDYAHYLIVFPRIVLFVALAGICCFYWLVVWLFPQLVHSLATFVVVIYMFFVGLVAILRIPFTGARIESGFYKLLYRAKMIGEQPKSSEQETPHDSTTNGRQ